MHPINSVKGAITAGVVLAVIIGVSLSVWAGVSPDFHPVRIDRWLHILAGITWIGLLYYFNFVQTPGLAAAAADKGGPGGAGITKYIAPRALLWFRWAAVVTWLSGAGYLMTGYGNGNMGAIVSAFTLQPGVAHDRRRRLARDHHAVQRLGASSGRIKRRFSASCRQPTRRRRRRARLRARLRASTSYCRCRC